MRRRKFIELAATTMLGIFALAILATQTWKQTSQQFALTGKKLGLLLLALRSDIGEGDLRHAQL
jgi:hypothetical protein